MLFGDVFRAFNPWRAIEALVTRRDPDGVYAGVLGGHQAIELEDALAIFTINGALAMGQEDLVGSIEPGKRADLIVVDRHLFEISSEELGSTLVDLTMVDGEVVYERTTSVSR